MSANIVNQMPFVRTSRNFPEDIPQLTVELNKSYLDLANAVNASVKGIFPTNRPAITGEAWFLTGAKQQTLRQVYTITTTATPTPHNIKKIQISQFTRCWGTYTDSAGINSYGLVWGTNQTIAGLITFFLTATNITFLVGAGAPALSKGTVILEWLADV